jgi:hypothetical protein
MDDTTIETAIECQVNLVKYRGSNPEVSKAAGTAALAMNAMTVTIT